MDGGAPVSGGDGDGWIQYRIFLANPTETTPRGKELEALSWIPTLDREASELLGAHHWHREGFRLRLVPNEKASTVQAKNEPHLVGRTEFGESLDDEWLIVWLLFELSKRHPELLISVMDNDGQFLLIEAALVLPRWLKPENSDHRVWIRGGRLHIIPRPSAAHPSLPTKLDLLGALGVLRSGAPTRADELIERTIRDRVSGMPNAELNLLHHATVLVPMSAARLLHADASLVAAAVAAFYTRDVDGMKVASRMARFDPRRTPLVPMRLRFTRLQYAQLDRQPFPPPPAFTLPPRASAEFRAAEAGMKLSVGLEILAALAKPDPLDELAPLPAPALPVAAADAEWADFLRLVRTHSLGGGGGGGGIGVPSDEDVAHAFLRTTRSSLYRDAAKKSWHYKLTCAESAPCDETSLKAATSAPRVPDDPLDWMNVTAEMVEDILARTEREMRTAEAEGGPPRPPPSAEAMAEQVKRFVEAKSGLEGVEPARGTVANASSMRSSQATPPTGAQGRSPAPAPAPAAPSADPTAPAGDVSFDPAKFLQALRSTLDYEGVDGDEAEEGDEDGELDGSSADDSDGADDGADDLAGDSEEEAELRAYMDEMERQLRGTAMADTFEREPAAPRAKNAATAHTAGGAAAAAGAEAKGAAANKATVEGTEEEEDDDDDELPPVDLDLNLVKNLLDSIAGQHGLPGPASALLASLSQAKSKKP